MGSTTPVQHLYNKQVYPPPQLDEVSDPESEGEESTPKMNPRRSRSRKRTNYTKKDYTNFGLSTK